MSRPSHTFPQSFHSGFMHSTSAILYKVATLPDGALDDPHFGGNIIAAGMPTGHSLLS